MYVSFVVYPSGIGTLTFLPGQDLEATERGASGFGSTGV